MFDFVNEFVSDSLLIDLCDFCNVFGIYVIGVMIIMVVVFDGKFYGLICNLFVFVLLNFFLVFWSLVVYLLSLIIF